MRAPLPTAFDPLPEIKEPSPMTAREFKRLSSMLTVIMGNPEPQIKKSTKWMEHASPERRLAGFEPLPAWHPIARSALPKLRSIRNG